ncbi:hypothetical protein [Mycobacterium sp.]|uniref:hypothetical protein n=1 Tax=Mycobacterium sp. TaxID=1785 RepID=UPI003F9AF68A
MSTSREAETLANGATADAFFCDVLAKVHPRREHKMGPERVVEIGGLCFSEF